MPLGGGTRSPGSYAHGVCVVLGAVEQEGAEDRNPHAVAEQHQVGLGELEGGRVLVHQLPHAVQEEQEERRLEEDRRNGGHQPRREVAGV